MVVPVCFWVLFCEKIACANTQLQASRATGKLWLGDADSPLAPYSDLLVRTVLARNRPSVNPEQGLSGCFLAVDLPNDLSTRVIVVAVKKNLTMFQALELAGKAVSQAMEVHPAGLALVDAWRSPTVDRDGFASEESVIMMEAGVAAALAAGGPMPTEMKSEATGEHGLETLSIFSSALDTARLNRIQATAEGTNLCRYMTAAPPSTLNNLSYREWVKAIAEKESWQVLELDEVMIRSRRRIHVACCVA